MSSDTPILFRRWRSAATQRANDPQQSQDLLPTINSPISNQTDQPPPTSEWSTFFTRHKERQVPNNLSRQVALTTLNSRNNQSWGDELGQKPEEFTRVYAINVNGFTLDRRGGQYDTICRNFKEMQVDIACVQEHNLDTTQAYIRSILYDTANQHWDRNRISVGTTPITVNSSYKPGGTLVMSVGSITGRVTKQISDKWGRWTCQEFQGKTGRRVAVVSVYQPIVNGSTAGKITVAAQQRSLLLQDNDTISNPRTAFRRDLTIEIQRYHNQSYEILLIGDFNETFGNDPDGMCKLAGKFELVNLMTCHHSASLPATYARGTKCLDYALGSRWLVQSLRQCGYEPFNSRIHSDHRGMFLDFDTKILFGTDTQQLQSRQLRDLSASNLKQVTAYIRKKHELLLAVNAFQRADRLLALGNRHSFAERLDQDVLQASITAEKSIPKYDSPAWSKELAQARQTVVTLTKHLSYLRSVRVTNLQPGNTPQQHVISFQLPQTIQECSNQLRQTKAEVATIVQHSFKRRDEERDRTIKDLEDSHQQMDRERAKILRRLKKAEDIKQLFRKLKKSRLSTKTRQGLTRIEIPSHPDQDPKTCDDWTQIDVPTDILRLLQDRNRKHFGQAQGTPFTVPPLSELLGFRGDGDTGQSILNGTYNMEEHETNVQILLQHMQQVQELQQDPSYPSISAEDFEDKLKVWTETTTTSPSGMHLGHYKALIARHSFSSMAADDDLTPEYRAQRDELNEKQSDLFTLHLSLINYALERGYSYRRWQTIANTILFKDPDNVRLHRTRVIHIYEADFNLALGVKWRAAMHQAEDLKKLNDGQYGSRPNRNATDPVFIEELQCEISRATRKSVVLTNYDATACYDRIVPNLGMLVSQKYGVPAQVTRMNASTLEQAEYRIRTEMGLAKEGYRHSEDAPIYGTGQGSANSPAVWCFLSSTLFDCYDQTVRPATYSNISNDTAVTLGMIGFVDDCNGQTNLFDQDETPMTIPNLLQQSQENAQQWNDLLTASGGALEISKTSCHVLNWTFAANGAPVLAPLNPSYQDTLRVVDNLTGEVHSLELLSSYAAHKTLGHYKDPAGTQLEQFRQLLKKSDSITNFLWTCPLSRLEAWTYYYACYLPSVCYPLSCSSMSKKQIDKVQRKAMAIIVARCGYNRNTKKEVLYGPLELGGANFRHLYVQQGIGQVCMFIRHWRQKSVAGRLLRIAVSWFQQQVGVSYSILENVQSHLPHLESKWLSSVRTFMHSIDIKLQLDEPAIPPLQRMYDVHIMDAIISSKQFTAAEIRRLNYCRLYLKAVTISDLTHIAGTRLDLSKLAGTPSVNSSATVGPYIHQDRPGEPEWRLWKRANLIWSDAQGSLYESLGPWILPSSKQHQRHLAYWHRRRHNRHIEIWVRTADGYQKCRPCPEEEGQFQETHHKPTPIKDLPLDMMYPIAVRFIGSSRWKKTHDATLMSPFSAGIPATFDQYVNQLPPWEAELLNCIDWHSDAYSVSNLLTHGLCVVSDGSVWDNNQGAYGWVLSTDRGERCASGMGPVRGAHPDSFRAEAYGMLTVVCFLTRLAIFTSQHDQWSGVLATDSESLLNVISWKPQELPTPILARNERQLKTVSDLDVQCPEWDIVVDIVRRLRNLPGVYLQHVRGHQDNAVTYDQLPLLAQLNVDADALATRFQQQHRPMPIALLTESAGVHLVTPTGTITSHYDAAIRFQATHQPLMNHLQLKNGWTSQTSGWINWKAHGAALRSKIKCRTHFVKLVHGALPTAKRIHRHDRIRRLCPKCEREVEDWEHILKCAHQTRGDWRKQFLQTIEAEATALQTRPILIKVLVDAMTSWFTLPEGNLLVVDALQYLPDVRQLINRQNIIGWQHIFMGRFTWEWSDVQDAYYAREPNKKDSPKRRTGPQWQVKMINSIWDQWRKLWLLRNQDLHGADERQQRQAITRNLRRQLSDIYDARDRLEPSVQALLHKNVNEHYEKANWVNQTWLAIHAPLVKASMKRVSDKAILGVKSIRHYFGPR